MQATSKKISGHGLTVRAGMFAALAVGCAAAFPGFAFAESVAKTIDGAQYGRKIEKQVAAAEKAAIGDSQNAELRSRLGQVYLAVGRFPSAAASFEDAVALGDKSPATALGMALSYIGSGRNAEGTALLGQWRESIPVGDYALALALAGQPEQAVLILGEVMKSGEDTPKLRQNLAYAFALDGKLHEARVLASQDVPADQLDARVSDWALQASMGSTQSRVAALLGAPLRSDPGRPAELALQAVPQGPMLAAAEPAAASEELPALAEPQPIMARYEPIASEPVAQVQSPGRFVSEPIIQDVPSAAPRHLGPRQLPVSEATQRLARAAATRPAPRKPVPAAGTHMIQLGSFTTEEGARRAWGIFVRRDPSLKNRELRITEALVHGRRYFRVAAAGYDATGAAEKCSAVRGQGRDCLAYASDKKSIGSMPIRAIAQRMARR